MHNKNSRQEDKVSNNIMTLETLKDFIKNNDFGFASANGTFGAICEKEQRGMLLSDSDKWNSPELVEGDELDELIERFPEFKEEIDNGCRIYKCEVYEGANRMDVYYFAYYE